MKHKGLTFRVTLALVLVLLLTPVETAAAQEPEDPFDSGDAALPERALVRIEVAESVNPVDPATLTCSDVINFDGLSEENYDEAIDLEGASFAERLAGQSLTYSGNFDVLSGVPSKPLTLQVGEANKNLHIAHAPYPSVLVGLGPLGFPNADAIGEGAIAALFDTDQSELGFQIFGANAGLVTVNFFQSDGSLIHTSVFPSADGVFAFRRSGGVKDIAGISIHNSDPWGIGYDNFVICPPPTADPNGPYTGFEGSPIPLDGTGSSDPDGDPLTYSWSVDSGLCTFDDDTSPTPNLTCTDNGEFTVTLVVDDGLATDNDTASVAVANVAPSLLNVSVTSPINESEEATLSGDISDPSNQDTFTLQVDWGDGSPLETFSYAAGTTEFEQTHKYLDDNPTGKPSDDYTINLYIVDDDDPPSWYGNRYQLVVQSIAWPVARAAAEAMIYSGCAGHLVTITSQEEQDFLYGEFGAGLAQKWYGGFDTTPDSPAEGWQWVTGEPWSYTNWYSGEPNNGFPVQPYLQGWPPSWGGLDIGKYWDDNQYPGSPGVTPTGYVVEYDCGLGTASVVIKAQVIYLPAIVRGR